QEVVEGLMVGVGDQVAGAFPTLEVASRAGPGRALHLALPLEEFLVDWRGMEAVLAKHPLGGPELGLDVLASHEDFLGIDGRVAVGRRDDEAVDIKGREKSEKRVDL